MKDNFYITIETFHIADRGQQENVHELDKKALKERQVSFLNVLPDLNILNIFFQVVPIDIANDAVTTADYKVHLLTIKGTKKNILDSEGKNLIKPN